MSKTTPGSVIHHNIAMIACDNAGTLKETLHKLGDLPVHAVTVGERHIVLPAAEVGLVLERLREHGHFPRLVGEPMRPLQPPDPLPVPAPEATE